MKDDVKILKKAISRKHPCDESHKALERVERERDRLLVLATKHCPTDHHDFGEILRLAED